MKIRLDDYLVLHDFVPNKSKARLFIKEQNDIYIKNKLIKKSGFLIDQNENQIEINQKMNIFVSRAGLKLDKAITKWNINLKDKISLDIGASTGGFTQCSLNHGAKLVYSVDVGSNQLDSSLRKNHKVINKEHFNFKNATKKDFDQEIDFFSCDVSFISLQKILFPLTSIIENETQGVILIKPQFESTPSDIKNGKVNSKQGHISAIKKVIKYSYENGFSFLKLDYSPIKGNKKQNIEYLALIKKQVNPINKIDDLEIEKVINDAWNDLK